MKLPYLLNIKNPIEDFLQALICTYKETGISEIKKLFSEQCDLLIQAGCDFYDLPSLYMNFAPFTEDDQRIILAWSPIPSQSFTPEIKNIKKSISRWTCSKYHTDTITEVIKDIQRKIGQHQLGIYQYNSNLNNKNRRSLNDLYVLVIAEQRILWYDINKKITSEFIQTWEAE